MLPQRHQILNIFGPSVTTLRELLVLPNFSHTNVKKVACPETTLATIFRKLLGSGIKDFSKGGIASKVGREIPFPNNG